jgi:MoaA/NifB/PqqE/SkfB family radical SAM enzyme
VRQSARRVAARVLRAGHSPRDATTALPLDALIGAKLELTHRCNLRCGFCYTDSPARTLARPAELSDADWSRVVDQLLEIGVLEVVVTGGEPLLRGELALAMIERLAEHGIATILNTNGWHVDAARADRLAGVPGLQVYVSLDGACAATHDASRGVPGSWRRAIRAIDLLCSRGVEVVVAHVLTAPAADQLEPLLRQLRSLGAAAIRISPILAVGAAADGDWALGETEDRRALTLDPRWRPLRVELLPPATDFAAAQAALLVRPNGDVVPNSRIPVVFGHALADGLTTSWQRLVAAGGQAPRPPEHVAYRDPDVRRDGRPAELRPAGPAAETLRRRTRDARAKAPQDRHRPRDLADADAVISDLVQARRHQLGPVRRGARSSSGQYIRMIDSHRIHRLNPAASEILEDAAERSIAEAISAHRLRHPDRHPDRVADDVADAIVELRARGILTPVPVYPA